MTENKRRLLDLLRSLDNAQQESLLDYAAYLASRKAKSPDEEMPAEPVDIPRPQQESVIKAMKRLSATYPMLERGKLLDEASVLMTQHVMVRRDAVEVIDEMEILFRTYYDRMREKLLSGNALAK